MSWEPLTGSQVRLRLKLTSEGSGSHVRLRMWDLTLSSDSVRIQLFNCRHSDGVAENCLV